MMLKYKIYPQGMASTLENMLPKVHMVVKAWNSQPKYLGINANSATNESDAAVIRNSILWDVTSSYVKGKCYSPLSSHFVLELTRVSTQERDFHQNQAVDGLAYLITWVHLEGDAEANTYSGKMHCKHRCWKFHE